MGDNPYLAMSLKPSNRLEAADYNSAAMATRLRLQPKDRKELLLAAALEVAVSHGYLFMTRDDIAKVAECSPTLVPRYLGTMATLRKVIMRRAIKDGNLAIIVQGLASKDPLCAKLPDDVKKAAAATLIGG
jgi:AcrR family transcriptional regulator